MYDRQDSGVELQSLESEFTAQQLANFRQAFAVFDVNKDGKISQAEIFEVLQTMGNEVSEDRKNKIRQAMQTVDVDQSNDLDFPEFIHFMKIMDEHNKYEAVDEEEFDEEPDFEDLVYNRCIRVGMEERESRNLCCLSIVSIVFFVQLVYSLLVIADTILDEDLLDLKQHPVDCDDKLSDCESDGANGTNFNRNTVRYARAAALVLLLNVILLLLNKHQLPAGYGRLDKLFLRRGPGNYVRLISRKIFVAVAVGNVFFLGGSRPLLNFDQTDRFFDLNIAVPVIQVLLTFFCLSYLWYLDARIRPTKGGLWVVIVLLDVFVLNWIRLVVDVVKGILAILFVPVQFVMLLLMAMSAVCCKGCFDYHTRTSKTSHYFDAVAWINS